MENRKTGNTKVNMLVKRVSWLVGAVLVAGLVYVISRKVYLYGAAPVQAKDCDFIFPERVDQTKPTQWSVVNNEIVLEQTGGTVNDASCLNKTAVYGVVKVSSELEAQAAVTYARTHNLKITPAGQHHSMGGQSFSRDGLVLDTKDFNAISLSDDQQTITVQPGATWQQIQDYLDPLGLSVAAMQSINIFSVGGTLSVNAHGIAHNPGQVAPTVRSLRVLLSSGEIVTASLTENPELFSHVLGGYGLSGMILEAQLQVVPNVLYQKTVSYMDYHDFPNYYAQQVANDDQIGLFYARLSVSPTSYLTETSVRTYTKLETTEPLPALQPESSIALTRWVINFSKTGSFGRWLRWNLEKAVEPKYHACLSRNQAMVDTEGCIVTRNQGMYDSMQYLKNRLPDADILQEYFIPPEHMVEFVDGLRSTVQANDANLLNVTIRIVHPDTITALPYATGERFAFVLYFNQKLNTADSQTLATTTQQLIDLATSLNGTFYLPYQLVYSGEQLRQAYPGFDDFVAYKQTIDPEEIFSNTWYEQYKTP